MLPSRDLHGFCCLNAEPPAGAQLRCLRAKPHEGALSVHVVVWGSSTKVPESDATIRGSSQCAEVVWECSAFVPESCAVS